MSDLHDISECRHSPDFACVIWYGRFYEFNERQAAIIRILWPAWEQGLPVRFQQAVLAEAADTESNDFESARMSNIFRINGAKHPALLDGMIVMKNGTIALGARPKNLEETSG